MEDVAASAGSKGPVGGSILLGNKAREGPQRLRGVQLGVVAVDPLRAIGLGAILEDTIECTIHAVAADAIGLGDRFAAIVLDAAADKRPQWGMVTMVSTRNPRLPILVLGDTMSAEEIRLVHMAGAKGYLSNTAEEAEIRNCVTAVLCGSMWPSERVLDDGMLEDHRLRLAEVAAPRSLELRERLTPRECEVIDLLLDGRSNREIAVSMRIDEATVKAHLGRMLRKAGCSNRVELTLLALAERVSPRP